MSKDNGLDFKLNEGLTEEQLRLKYDYVETITGVPYVLKNAGPRTIDAHSTIEQFIDKVKTVIEFEQKDFKNKVILIDEFSKGNIFENPEKPGEDVRAVITYTLCRRAPGTTKGGNMPFDKSRTERVPQYRGARYDDVENPREIIMYMGQWFDNEICFDIHARSNKEANEIALWFENIMEGNRQFFAYNGILKYYFVERETDSVVKEGDDVVHVRPMKYWVRTEKCYEITEQAINKIVILLTTT